MNGFDNQGLVVPTDFAQQVGGRSFETGQLRGVSKIDYVIPYRSVNVLTPVAGDSQFYAIEGDYIAIDSTVSIGPVFIDVTATQSGNITNRITLSPGDLYVGRFKGLSLSAPGGACGRLLFGYGQAPQLRSRVDQPIGFTDPFVGSVVYTGSGTSAGATASFNYGSLWLFLAGQGVYRGFGVRGGRYSYGITVAAGSPCEAPVVCARLRSPGVNGEYFPCTHEAFNVHQISSGANNVTGSVKLPEMAINQIAAGNCFMDILVQASWSAANHVYNSYVPAFYYK